MNECLSHMRRVAVAVVLTCVCLLASGCQLAGHTAVDLTVAISYTDLGRGASTGPQITLPTGATHTVRMPRGLGDGTALMVRIDMEALPKDSTPDHIGAAALTIPVRSQSMKAGSASFGIYMLEVDPARKQAAYYAGLVPEGAKPLSICSLNHDAGTETKSTYYGSYSIPKFDNAVKRMNFNITEAVRPGSEAPPTPASRYCNATLPTPMGRSGELPTTLRGGRKGPG